MRAIAAYFADAVARRKRCPRTLDLHFERRQALRYGENPHQPAAFYVEPARRRHRVAAAEVLHGKELSYQQHARSR